MISKKLESHVILVNPKDGDIGSMEKMKAHREGVLHRAFSVFLFNSKGELLLQQRALSKYHSGGLWSNTCCSHPEPGQSLEDAVNAALMREVGVVCKTQHVGSFIYKEKLSDKLTEHEYDHLFIGNYDGDAKINPNEVAAIRYATIPDILKDLKESSSNYTVWFREAFEKIIAYRGSK